MHILMHYKIQTLFVQYVNILSNFIVYFKRFTKYLHSMLFPGHVNLGHVNPVMFTYVNINLNIAFYRLMQIKT